MKLHKAMSVPALAGTSGAVFSDIIDEAEFMNSAFADVNMLQFNS
jgi:hypothetical protein